MIHPHTRLAHISPTIGMGVVATQPIPRGTICWVLDPMDRILTPKDVTRLGPHYAPMLDTYAYEDLDGNAILCWDHARFVNHSCTPSLMSVLPSVEIAVRDIEVGEELTDDYGTLHLSAPMPCACGDASCRGEVRPDDTITQVATWDRLLAAAMPDVLRVAQPLAPLLKARDLRTMHRLSEGRDPIPSVGRMMRALAGPSLRLAL